MSIIINNTGNKIVATIAARDSLKKHVGLRVKVTDATADANLGGGAAEYLWDGGQWDLVWSSLKYSEWDDKLDEGDIGTTVEDAVETAIKNPVLDTYRLKSASSTGAIDLSEQQIAIIDGTVNRTISFTNVPSSNQALTVLVKFNGSGGTITWPSGIQWHNGDSPVLGTNYTLVSLLFDGTDWLGITSIKG